MGVVYECSKGVRTQPERSESFPGEGILKLSIREDQLEIEGHPKRSPPPCHCGATDFADGSDTSVWFSVSVTVDSLKPGMSCHSFRLESWRGRARQCVFRNGMSTGPALSNSTSGGT